MIHISAQEIATQFLFQISNLLSAIFVSAAFSKMQIFQVLRSVFVAVYAYFVVLVFRTPF